MGVGVVRRDDVSPGSARLELVDGVFLLHPEDAVFGAMLDGWGNSNAAGGLTRRRSMSVPESYAGS